MKVVVGMTIGLGVGLSAAGLAGALLAFREEVTHFGLIGLGVGLLAGGGVALALLLFQRLPSGTTGKFQEKVPS